MVLILLLIIKRRMVTTIFNIVTIIAIVNENSEIARTIVLILIS